MMPWQSRFLSSSWLVARNLSGKAKGKKEESSECDAPCRPLKGLVLGAYETCDGYVLTPTASKLDDETGGKISQSIKGARLHLGQTSLVTNLSSLPFHTVAVAGLGDGNEGKSAQQNLDEKKENVRIASAAGTLALEEIGVRTIKIEDFCHPQAAAEGAALGIWKYQELRDPQKRKKTACISMFKEEDRKEWLKGMNYACAQNTARFLEEVPPNIMTPLNFSQHAIDILCPLGVQVYVRDLQWIKKEGLTAFSGVAKGSCEYPYLVELHYCGGNGDPPLGFVGQGTTFNSGGICLKTAEGMRHMGADMAGAAVLVGLFQGAASCRTAQNLSALIPLYENMPGAMSLKPGDVISGLSGKTTRFQNTSLDARVVLGDVITYMSNFNSSQLYSIGTISHKGMTEALGNSASGLFTNSQSIAESLRVAGIETGDRVWRLPLWNIFSERTNTLCCDAQNETSIKGGDPSVAAAYLNKFLPDSVKKFAHLDIAGTGLLSGGYGKPYLEPQSMSGRPTRTLLEYVNNLPQPKKC